jgi:hypothetical protein
MKKNKEIINFVLKSWMYEEKLRCSVCSVGFQCKRLCNAQTTKKKSCVFSMKKYKKILSGKYFFSNTIESSSNGTL